jgi:hypothetical protein
MAAFDEALASPALYRDPYPLFHQLRDEQPVYWSAVFNSWLVTRYADVVSGLRDHRLSGRRTSTFIDQQLEQFESRVMGSELTNPDLVRLAESFGVSGARAKTPAELEGLLRETLSGGSEPVVIEVPVGPMPNPFHTLRSARHPARGRR